MSVQLALCHLNPQQLNMALFVLQATIALAKKPTRCNVQLVSINQTLATLTVFSVQPDKSATVLE
jgi:hypothetical protein